MRQQLAAAPPAAGGHPTGTRFVPGAGSPEAADSARTSSSCCPGLGSRKRTPPQPPPPSGLRGFIIASASARPALAARRACCGRAGSLLYALVRSLRSPCARSRCVCRSLSLSRLAGAATTRNLSHAHRDFCPNCHGHAPFRPARSLRPRALATIPNADLRQTTISRFSGLAPFPLPSPPLATRSTSPALSSL